MEKKQAVRITTVTLVGFINYEFPMEHGNCFSMKTDDDKEYKIVNFNYENFKELLERKVIEYPVTIGVIAERTAVILDSRIPNDWYSDTFCSTCTPMDLIPLPQRIKQLLDIDRGLREEREVEMNGIKFMMTTTRQIKEPEIIYAPYIMKLNEGKTEG